MKSNKVSLLVGSSDAYSHVLKNFFILLDRYFRVDCEIILVGETISCGKDVTEILPGIKPWGERILAGLEKVKAPYCLFFLDDYYLSETFDEDIVENGINLLNEFGADKVLFDVLYPPGVYSLSHQRDNIYSFNLDSDYLLSVQPGLWKTEYLKETLKPEYSPWDFEVLGNSYARKLGRVALLEARSKKLYFNAYRRGGFPEIGLEEFLKSQKLTWN